jgi:hypothetical protein
MQAEDDRKFKRRMDLVVKFAGLRLKAARLNPQGSNTLRK